MTDISSVAQDEWKEITEAIRMQIQKNCQKLPSMSGDEIESLINLVNEAMSLDVAAELYDAYVETKRKQI